MLKRHPFSLETKDKMRLRRLQYFETHSPWNKGRKETRPDVLEKRRINAQKMSERMKGNKNLLGYHFSEESKMKMSERLKGNKHALGKHLGNDNPAKRLDVREKIRKKAMGNTWTKGIPKSEIHKKHISEAKKRLYSTIEGRESQRIRRLAQVVPLSDTSIERKLQEQLQKNNVHFEKHKHFHLSDGSYHPVDLFIEPNICIEADGDYYHNFPYGTERDRFIDKELILKGNKIFRFWEHEINNNAEECVYRIWEHETKDLHGLEEKVKLIVDAFPSLGLRLMNKI